MSTPRDPDFDWRIRIRDWTEDDVAEKLEELEAKLAELRGELNGLIDERAKMQDELSIAHQRLRLCQAAVRSAEHQMEMWRKQAQHNEVLHHAAHSELMVLKAAMGVKGG